MYNHGFSFISIFQKVDIAIGAITVTWLRSTAVDFSVPYFEAGVGFLANIPRKLSKWAALRSKIESLFIVVSSKSPREDKGTLKVECEMLIKKLLLIKWLIKRRKTSR